MGGRDCDDEEDYYDQKVKAIRRMIIIGGSVLFAIILICSCITIIPTGYTGVRTTFGQIDEAVVPNGPNFKIPIVQKIQRVNNKLQDTKTPEDYQIWSETKERTALYYTDLTITYQISREKSAWIYANVSNYKSSLLSTDLIASAVKSASKTLSDTDATNRAIIEPLVTKTLQDSVDSKYGKNVLFISKVIISNADFEESYNNAVAEKQKAQLTYEQQQIENKKSIEKAEASAKVKEVEANANKKQTEINAEAKANATITEAQAQAKANQMINDSVTDKVIAYMQADKWDGKRSKVVLGNGSDVMIDAGSVE